MPANIIVGAQRTFPRAHHEHALARDIHHEIAPGSRDIFLASRVEPLAHEDPLLLAREQLRREIVLARERPLHSLRLGSFWLGHGSSNCDLFVCRASPAAYRGQDAALTPAPQFIPLTPPPADAKLKSQPKSPW